MTVLGHTVELGSPTGGAGSGAAEYRANLFVESDDPQDTGHAILNYVIGEGFDYGVKWEFGNDVNERVRLYQIDPPQFIASSAYKWRVSLKYKEIRATLAYSETKINPQDWQPKIKVRSVGRMQPVTDGIYRGGLDTGWEKGVKRQITNSAGAVFSDPPLEFELWNKSLRVMRRTTAVEFNDTSFPTFWINDRDFTVFNDFIAVPIKKYELLFGGWEVDEEQYEGLDVVRVEFIGEVKKGGWREELLDQGYVTAGCAPDGGRPDGRGGYYYDSEDPANIAGMKNILDRNGNHPRSPVPLDGAGNALGDCDKTRFYGEWSVMDEIDPTALGFFAGITSVPAPE